MKNSKFPWITMLLLISFASVNAVIPAPALPEIGLFFNVNQDLVQLLMSLYLIGYALGQLLYGPLSNRYGRKPALYIGIAIQIASNILCIFAGMMNWFVILPFARFFMAIGAGVGLKMTFTLINETSDSIQAAKRTAVLLTAFAIAPGLGIFISSLFFSFFSWQGCFYFGLGYGLALLILIIPLPETLEKRDNDAFNRSVLIRKYLEQFNQKRILQNGLLMGCVSSFVYIFATLAPIIAIEQNGYSEVSFALINLLPSLGMLLGAIAGPKLTAHLGQKNAIVTGIRLITLGVIGMGFALIVRLSIWQALFIPMAFINFSTALILANTSSLALQENHDKSNGSAVLNFINMGMAAMLVLFIGKFHTSPLLLLVSFIALSMVMFIASPSKEALGNEALN